MLSIFSPHLSLHVVFPIFLLLKPKTYESTFTPAFHSHPTANPPENSNSSILRIYPEFQHFPPPDPTTMTYCLDYSKILLSLTQSRLLLEARVIPKKCKGHVSHSAQNATAVSLSLKDQSPYLDPYSLWDLPPHFRELFSFHSLPFHHPQRAGLVAVITHQACCTSSLDTRCSLGLDLEMERSSWIIQVGPVNQKAHYKREGEGDYC